MWQSDSERNLRLAIQTASREEQITALLRDQAGDFQRLRAALDGAKQAEELSTPAWSRLVTILQNAELNTVCLSNELSQLVRAIGNAVNEE